MSSMMATALRAPDYNPRLTTLPGSDDRDGSLPNIGVHTPRSTTRLHCDGLPGSPSPHLVRLHDPAVQSPSCHDWRAEKSSTPRQTHFATPAGTLPAPGHYEHRPARSPEHHQYDSYFTPDSYYQAHSHPSNKTANPKAMDRGTQTEGAKYQPQPDGVENTYCKGCQRRLLRRSNTTSSATSSASSRASQALGLALAASEPSVDKERPNSSLGFGRRFFHRGDDTARQRQDAKAAAKARKEAKPRNAKKVDYEVLESGEQDHWAAE